MYALCGLTQNRKALEQTRKKNQYIKTALQIAKNETPKDRKDKEQARAQKKLTSERIRALQTAQMTTPQERWVKDCSGKKREKVHSEERKEPYIRESSHIK